MNNNILLQMENILSCHNIEDQLTLSQKPCRITLPILIFTEYNKADIQNY